MVVIGIDPGKTGGIAFMNSESNCKAFPLPIEINRVDVGKLQEIILEQAQYTPVRYKSVAYIERQHVRAMQRGGILIGENYGRVLAVLDLLEIPYVEVLPYTWKGTLFPGVNTKGDKEITVKRCLDQGYKLPTLRPNGKKLHDGVADAICIAAYGWIHQDS